MVSGSAQEIVVVRLWSTVKIAKRKANVLADLVPYMARNAFGCR